MSDTETPTPDAPRTADRRRSASTSGSPQSRRAPRPRRRLRAVASRHVWRILPPAGKLALLTPAIVVPFLVHQQRQPLQLRHLHPDLRAARARAERRRRVRRPARPRLRRVLRLRRLRLRVPARRPTTRVHMYAHHWRAQYSIRSWSSARAARPLPRLVVATAARGLPRDRHALLPPALRRLRRTATSSRGTGSRAARTASPTSTRSTFFGGTRQIDTDRAATTSSLLGVSSSSCSSLLRFVNDPARAAPGALARGSARRRGDGHAGELAEAHGFSFGAAVAALTRDALRVARRRACSRSPSTSSS